MFTFLLQPIGSRIARRTLIAFAVLVLQQGQAPKPLTGVALVVGESGYRDLPQLPNAVSDAAAVADVLQSLGFETTVSSNLNARKFSRTIANFIDDAADADVAVIYYAGHGIEADGENWLVPIDADAATLDETDGRLLALSSIVAQLADTVPVAIVLLDACRSNPFPPGTTLKRKSGETVPVGRVGLGATRGAIEANAAPANASLGTVIGFSTEPGRAALDGPKGSNSPYAAALVRHLAAMDGAEFGIVMRIVTEEVYLKTMGEQRPWVNESLTRLLYLGAPPAAPSADESQIMAERRQLLMTISALNPVQRQQVEAASLTAKVPMDTLYGLLRSLGAAVPGDPAELEKVLNAQAGRVKELLAANKALSAEDPEIRRLTQLAESALEEGALDAYVELWERAKVRYQAVSATLDETEAKLRTRRLEGAEIFARTAAAHELAADYRGAAENYRLAYEQAMRWSSDRAWDYKRREADAWLSEGDERGNAEAVANSIATFEKALSLAPRETSPLAWALTQNNLGNALLVRGRSEPGTGSIEQALSHYRAALNVRSRDAQPALWARTQNNIAIASSDLAERKGDPRLLDEAILAYRAALSVTVRKDDPLLWATMVSNLGNALEQKGGGGLEEAVSLHREALKERQRDKLPVLWARSQESLGNALVSLGNARSDATLIKQGIASYRLALEVVQRNTLPLNWAGLHYNLGNALGTLSEHEERRANLAGSVAAYRNALLEERFDRTPPSWAKTEYMLGERLWDLGEEASDIPARKEAAEAFRQALRYYTRDRNEADWAITVYELGIRQHRLGLLIGDKSALTEAVSLLRDSLTFYTRERNAAEWAETASDYASALADQGYSTGSRQDLDEAIAVYRSVAEMQTRAATPLAWAATQVSLAGALYFSADLAKDAAAAREGREPLIQAAEEFDRHGDIKRATAARALLEQLDMLIAQLSN